MFSLQRRAQPVHFYYTITVALIVDSVGLGEKRESLWNYNAISEVTADDCLSTLQTDRYQGVGPEKAGSMVPTASEEICNPDIGKILITLIINN